MNHPNPLPTEWRKAFDSNSSGNCVQWRITADGVEVRDSKLGEDSPILSFTFDEWVIFTRAVKLGEADLRPSFETNPPNVWTTGRKGITY